MKKIAILGSTGSIGTQTLDVVRSNSDCQAVALAAGSNVIKMEEQIREFHPSLVAMWTEEAASDLRTRIADLDVKVVSGMEGLLEVAAVPQSEVLVTAIVGMIGIKPTIAAIEAGKDIALANKETLVTAGHIIMPLARECGAAILPVDSEHSAIFQSMSVDGRVSAEKAAAEQVCAGGTGKKACIEKILLTASGGPFRGRTRQQLADIRVEDALRHPNWSMGPKVTIDSSTLVNKGLEVMEAKWLFGVELDKIQVVVHPQSIIHSAVQYTDGAIIAQMGIPDMKLPIQYALFYPERRYLGGKRVDLFDLGQLTFERPDTKVFPGLALAYRAAETGGSMPTVFNAANEKAVALFLEGKIPYLGIGELIEKAMDQHHLIANPTVEDILAVEQQTYEYMQEGLSCK